MPSQWRSPVKRSNWPSLISYISNSSACVFGSDGVSQRVSTPSSFLSVSDTGYACCGMIWYVWYEIYGMYGTYGTYGMVCNV